MKKGNLIDLLIYREQRKQQNAAPTPISDELEAAIKLLIERMRKLGPLSNAK